MAGAGAAAGVMSEAIAFDSHRFVKNLAAGGLAEAIADEQAHLLNSNLATGAELEFEIERVRSDLEVEIEQVGAEVRQARAEVLKRGTDVGGISLGEVD